MEGIFWENVLNRKVVALLVDVGHLRRTAIFKQPSTWKNFREVLSLGKENDLLYQREFLGCVDAYLCPSQVLLALLVLSL